MIKLSILRGGTYSGLFVMYVCNGMYPCKREAEAVLKDTQERSHKEGSRDCN